MTEQLDFEARLAARLQARAALGLRPFDAAAIAHQVVGGGVQRRTLGLHPRPRLTALAWTAIVLLLVIALVGAVAIGAKLRDRSLQIPPQPLRQPANGEVVISANPWEYDGGENGDIYVVSPGSAPRRIIGSDGDGIAQECPRFSRDGKHLAYGEARASGSVTTHRGGWPVGSRAVVVVGIDEHGDPSPPLLRFAIPGGAGPMVCPEWSPKGDAVAFREGDQLWIGDVTRGGTRTFPIESASGEEANELEWSRDGSMVAVAEPGQIQLIHADGATSTSIAVDGAAPRSLGWTAQDQSIVYLGIVPVDKNGSALHVVGADGRHDERLTRTSDTPGVTFSFDQAAVSPDGLRVAYLEGSSRCASDGCGPGPSVAPVAITRIDGGNPTEPSIPLDELRAMSVDGSAFFASGLQWSPDGSRLLLSSIAGVVSIGVEPGTKAVIYANGKLDEGLNLEWSWSEVTWQPAL